MVEETAKFITEQGKDKPFFIYFALNTPHYPYQGEAKWLEHYKDLDYPRNLYAAFLSTQDARIGNLLDFLGKHDLRKGHHHRLPVGPRAFDRGARPLRRRECG